MAAFDNEGGRQRTNPVFRRGVYKTSYYLGSGLRKAVDFVLLPYGMMAKGFAQPRSDGRASRSAAAEVKPRKISSRLSRLNDRLRSLEQALSGRERRDGASFRDIPRDDWPASRDTGREMPDALIESLSDPNPAAREIALRTVSELSGEDAAVVIVDALHDTDPMIRRAAAAAAARIRSHAAVFSLILLLDDLQPEVRQDAKAAIEAITGRRIKLDPSADAPTRKKTIEELQSWWKEERFAKLSGELGISLRQRKNGQQ